MKRPAKKRTAQNAVRSARQKNLEEFAPASERARSIPQPRIRAPASYPLPRSSLPSRTRFAGLRLGDAGWLIGACSFYCVLQSSYQCSCWRGAGLWPVSSLIYRSFWSCCRHSTRFLFSAKRKPVEPERNAGGAVVGIASSVTARRARGSGGLPFYGRTELYERRKCAAVVQGAGDGDWWVSQCGKVRGSAWFL